MAQRSFRILLWIVALVGIGLDQTTKYGMFAWLQSRPEELYTAKVFNFENGPSFQLQARHQVNTQGELEPQVNSGALFGWLGEYKDQANNGFALVSLLAALAIVYWSFKSHTARDRWLCIALGLILAGTVGNLYDRVLFSGVRDFLDFYWTDAAAEQHHWPTFNLADCCLVCGAFLLLVQSFASSPATEKQSPMSQAPTSAQPTAAP
jgi:signal peptidase II